MRSHLAASVAALGLFAGAAHAQDLKFPIGEGPFSWDSYTEFADAHDYSGETVSITGPWTGPRAAQFEAAIAYFEEATGASVNYSGSDSFEQDIVISVEANSAPNIGVFEQPGLVADLAARGQIAALDTETADWLSENYASGDSWVGLSSFAGAEGDKQLFAFPYNIDLKSLVWYSPLAFEDGGYEIPETMEELKALTAQIAEDGGTPWCIALGSGAATGWPGTDWIEDLLLRTAEPEIYDQWVTHEIAFDHPDVIAAFEEFDWFLKDEYLNGGRSNSATADFRDSGAGLFAVPPECYMLKQGTFMPSFFPEGTEVGPDASFFYFPSYAEKDLGDPVLGAGSLFAVTEDSEATRGFIEFLKTPIAHEAWMAQSGFLTPYGAANAEVFPSDADRELNEILTDATVFRFDGSDLMPGEIGAGAFWTGMVDFMTGDDAESVASDIEDRWSSID
ncbi:alpha-glucoside ABC transporter substrate-binding protein [Roseivivax halodurans JCM 10272]|uniref:Alpha-glucoside ABC transporter substrate-binding protein n=1 Tax=Roseivivax halodurans JCM 10272 TaxID=1449350 RepID=X7E9W2_9RHOB|nr:ABC transporter substrate-binding protein [Roseivivax halodurans]ETX12747.1 alpha-glucoside ABC transporter substrate-binding protein [Roseivivax halodurans JCM 10272]